MSELELLKNIKIKQLSEVHADRIERIRSTLSPNLIIDPENSLADVYKQLKKEAQKAKVAEKRIKEAEGIILSIAGLVHGRVQPEHRTTRHKTKNRQGLPESIAESITVQQAIQLLRDGNRYFVERVKRLGSMVRPAQYDAVVIACSDARNVFATFDDFAHKNILVVQVAGNIYPKTGDVAMAKIDVALSKLREGGTVFVIGHEGCGAVAAKEHAHDYEGLSPSVHALLGNVDISKHAGAHDNCEANAANQAARLQENPIIKDKKATIVPCIFDFLKRKDLVQIGHNSENEHPLVAAFRVSIDQNMRMAKTAQDNLREQFAHTIVVCDPLDLGRFTDPRTVFDAHMNDLFCVSFAGRQLDASAIASIEYALLKVNEVNANAHIVVLHSDEKVAREIENAMTRASSIIRKRTKNGATVTIARFNQETGDVQFSNAVQQV